MFLKTPQKTVGNKRSNYSQKENTVKNPRKITIKTGSHAITSLTAPCKYEETNTMNTIQDKSKTLLGKVHDIDGNTKSIHENQTKSTRSIARSKRTIARKCIRESMAGWAMPAPNRIINLLEHPDLVEGAGELVTLQGEIHRACETLTQLETRHATMKQEFDSALKKASEEQHCGPKTNTTT